MQLTKYAVKINFTYFFTFLSMAMKKCKITYVVNICGLHFISVKIYSELRANYYGMGAAMCQNSLKLCQPASQMILVFSYLIDSSTLESKTTTRKRVLISYRRKGSSSVKRKRESSILIMLTLRKYIQGESKNGNWRQGTEVQE